MSKFTFPHISQQKHSGCQVDCIACKQKVILNRKSCNQNLLFYDWTIKRDERFPIKEILCEKMNLMRQLEEMHRLTKKQRGKYSLIAAFIHICIIYILPEKKNICIIYASNALPCSKNVKHARLENDLNWTKSKTYTLRTQCGFSNHTMLACLKIEIILCPLVLWGPTFTGSQCICTLFEHLP